MKSIENYQKWLQFAVNYDPSKGGQVSVNESGYARIANIMRGLLPEVKTFAILTAENPYVKKTSSEENKDANQELKNILKSGNYGYQMVKGHYGNSENSFFIPNISQKYAMELGLKFEQESIVWGTKTRNTQNNETYSGMNIQLISTLKSAFGKVEGERKVFINDNNAKDSYTEVNCRKFTIPFFDDEYEDADWEPNSGLIVKKESISEWFITEINRLSKKSMENDGVGFNGYKTRGILLRELRRYKSGTYLNEGNQKFFGLADGYFTGTLKL
jgi:hypothetical protein